MQVDALAEDAQEGLRPAIRLATLAAIGATASLTMVEQAPSGQLMVTKGGPVGMLERSDERDTPLTAYIAKRTPMGVVQGRGFAAVLDLAERDIKLALASQTT